MRRIAIAGQGQGSRTSAPLQAEALAYFARMTVPPSAAFREAVNWAIWRWKAIGAWSQITGLWILSADTAQAGLLSVIGDTPRDAVTVGTSPAFTALKGFSGFTETRQIRFPITATILSVDNCVAFIGAKVSAKYDGITGPGLSGYATGNFIKSDGGTGSGIVGNFHIGDGLSGQPSGLFQAKVIVPCELGQSMSVVAGYRDATSFVGGSMSSNAFGGARSSNYITRDMAFHPIDRFCAYGFLAGGASDAIARKFHAILAEMLNQLGALD